MNWRDSGDTDLASWTASFPANSDIIKRGEQVATYNAARPYTRLCRGMLEAESSGATHYNAVPASMHNPLNLRIRGKEPFQQFDSIAACVIEWKDRLTSPTYAYKDTQTVADLVHIYAPASDNNDEETYVKTVERVIDLLPPLFNVPIEHPQGGTPVVKDSEGFELNMTPGLIPEAGYADRLIPDANNSAWDNLGQRVVRGVTLHRMLGSLEGTDTYFRNGAAGLTDMGAKASSDLVYRWNDETGKGHQGISANRAPWASGPYRATAYGDGLKFTNKYGVNAVNRDRRSLEIDGFYGDPWSQASMQEYAQTTAHDAHNYGITWEQFPHSPKDDCSFICWHNEFCGTDYKECPGSVVMSQTDTFIGIVKGIMKAAQQGKVTQPGEPAPPPPVVTPVPVNPYPKGATEEWVRVAYGSVKVPWAARPFVFDITRSECRAWLAYCTSTIPAGGDYTDGHWGALEKVIRRGNKGSNGRDFLFSHGFIYHQEPRDKQKGPIAA